MLKRIILLSCIMGTFALSFWAEAPKIAVLDVTTPKGFDASVIIPVTESIMEQFVASKKYTVLDRANIEAIFKERDFQLSGEVSNDQVTQAGKFLGAKYVVVSKIQLVGGSYFLSAKMIDTETAAIVNQSSDSQKGDASIVISMAQNVGVKLAGSITEASKPAPAEPAATKPEVAEKPAPSPKPSVKPAREAPAAGDQKAPIFRIVADLSFPTWSGDVGTEVKKTGNSLETNYLADNTKALDIGFEAYSHLNLGEWFYLAAEFDYFSSLMQDSSFASSSTWYTDITLSNIMGGLGVSIPLSYWGQIYGGALVGAGTFDIGDLWTKIIRNKIVNAGGTFTLPSNASDTGLAYALEVGASVFLAHYLTIDFRFRYGGAVFDGKSGSVVYWYIPSVGTLPSLEYATVAFGVGLSL